MHMVDHTRSRCEFVRECEAAAREAYRKAAKDWSSDIAWTFGHVCLELRRILHRHAWTCPVCAQECAGKDR